MAKLDEGTKRLLMLAIRDADWSGWANVSKVVWPAIAAVPDEILEKRPDANGGSVRITRVGEAVLRYC